MRINWIFFFILGCIVPSLLRGQTISYDSSLISPYGKNIKKKPDIVVNLKLLKNLRGGSRLYLRICDTCDDRILLLKRHGKQIMDTVDRFDESNVFFIDDDFPHYVVCSVNDHPTPGSPISGPVLYGLVIDKDAGTLIWRDSGYGWCIKDHQEGEVVSLKGKSDLKIFTIVTQATEHYNISENWDHIWDVTITRKNVVVKYSQHGDNPDEKYTKKLII